MNFVPPPYATIFIVSLSLVLTSIPFDDALPPWLSIISWLANGDLLLIIAQKHIDQSLPLYT